LELTRFLMFGAIAGGVLRIANAFTAGLLGPEMLQVSYAITDLFLLMGLAGILITWRVELELLGYLGVSVAALGLIVIRATGFTSLAMSGYLLGAGIALVGVALLGIDMLRRRIGGRIAPLFWLASFALALWGAVGGQAAQQTLLQTLAGIAFGAGFVFAGWTMLSSREPVAQA
jgi:hypothetical protein